ncbi:MAG: O-antigen ligase family protein, partial [Candidatus Omnitrophica bacterium]|nr:O-antigen ligase family protein [Candidatus Omnitrophota bacterium]
IFFMVSNNIKNVKQIKIFAYLMLLVCFLVALNGWQQHAQGIDRVSAPFEGEGGEPNTLGGYLVFMMAIMLGLIIYSPNSYARFLILGLLFFCFPVLLWTLSRSSWIAFISMYLSFIILSKKAKPLLLIIFLLTLIILPQTLPLSVRNRIKETFIGQERILLGKKITFDESTTARLESWKVSLELWQNRPFFGYGVSSSVVTDHQYARVLKETGFFGFLSFVWILWTVFKFAFLTYQNAPTNFSKGLGLGFLCGYIGLLVHALGAATFIIIRIMEPFWFLTALVINLGQINKEIYDLKFAT